MHVGYHYVIVGMHGDLLGNLAYDATFGTMRSAAGKVNSQLHGTATCFGLTTTADIYTKTSKELATFGTSRPRTPRCIGLTHGKLSAYYSLPSGRRS